MPTRVEFEPSHLEGKKETFQWELMGSKLLKLAKEHGRVGSKKLTKWGPDLAGIILIGQGREWKITGTHWSGFTAYSKCGRYRWQGKFHEAEEDFEL